MDIRKHVLFFYFFVFFVLLICDIQLASEFVTASTATKETSGTFSSIHMAKWIQQQTDGTIDVCSDILGPKRKNDIKKTHNECPQLKVWVPKKTVFTEFVNVNEEGELKGGFSIAIFCLLLRELPFNIQPIFVPFINETTGGSMGSYGELVQQIEGKRCEAAAGDITITPNRIIHADFTIAYMSSEIYMLVPAAQKWNQTLVTLLRPFTPRLWVTIFSACIFIGIAIGILEYRVGNPEFNVPFYQKLIVITWFPVSTFFFHEGRIHNRCSKIVLVIWLTTIFIVIQIFTACLSSWLVVNQLQPKVPKQYQEVGYQNGSCVEDFAKNYVQNSSTIAKLKPLSSMDDYKNVLDTGLVDAIFEEIPFIERFIAKYGDNYMKVGPLAAEPGLGFAFSLGSPLQPDFSRAVVKVIGSPEMMQVKKEYLGIQTPLPAQPTDSFPQSLDVHSFFLLFIIMGLATLMAIICSEISLMRATAPILPVVSRHVKQPVQTSTAHSAQVVKNEL